MGRKAQSFITIDNTLVTDCSECTLNPGCEWHAAGGAVCEQAALFETLTGASLRKAGVCGCPYGWLADGLSPRTWREYTRDNGLSIDASPILRRLPPPDVLEGLLDIKKKEEEIF